LKERNLPCFHCGGRVNTRGAWRLYFRLCICEGTSCIWGNWVCVWEERWGRWYINTSFSRGWTTRFSPENVERSRLGAASEEMLFSLCSPGSCGMQDPKNTSLKDNVLTFLSLRHEAQIPGRSQTASIECTWRLIRANWQTNTSNTELLWRRRNSLMLQRALFCSGELQRHTDGFTLTLLSTISIFTSTDLRITVTCRCLESPRDSVRSDLHLNCTSKCCSKFRTNLTIMIFDTSVLSHEWKIFKVN